MFSCLVQTVVSKRGLPSSSRHQPFYSLLLDIEPDGIRSLAAALDHLVAREEIEGFKNGAGQEVAASKQSKIARLPPVLMITLMRFAWGADGLRKLTKHVDLPLRLALKSHWLNAQGGGGAGGQLPVYQLHAVVKHLGATPQGGHYVCDIFHKRTGKWLHCDDDRITVMDEARVLGSPNAYLLFYEAA